MRHSKISNSTGSPSSFGVQKSTSKSHKMLRKLLKFKKWSKGIKCSVLKLFSLAKLIFWIAAIFVEKWGKQFFTYGEVDFWRFLRYWPNEGVNLEKKIFNSPMLISTSVGNSWVMISDFNFFSGFWFKY